jgi:ATP/ADP translocase
MKKKKKKKKKVCKRQGPKAITIMEKNEFIKLLHINKICYNIAYIIYNIHKAHIRKYKN